ncbi:uncharacterized protein LOC127864140 [Dreissena polymorpha]|uniref:uncharacterized protein LOC127864140 n=1 Tax=Dreissena polymorpha TaxID=45954 RepID=UPI0022641B39|nr:uncharacterized protein LOC127864140 [Dreissena polymorpha]
MDCKYVNADMFSYGEEDKRVFRIDSILKEEGAYVLRHCLANQLGGQALTLVLSQPSISAKIGSAQKRKVINKMQYDLLYPSGGPVDISTFDVTLLAFLLRELHPTMNSASMVWINPNPGDFSEEADVTRLRMFRNKFVHEGSSKLSEKEFSALYVELRDVISRLARSSGCIDFSAMVDRLEQKKVGPFESFERKPAVNDQSTSVSSSLEENIDNCGHETIVGKPEFHVNNVSANEDGLEGKCRYHEVEVIDPAGSFVSFQGSDSQFMKPQLLVTLY